MIMHMHRYIYLLSMSVHGLQLQVSAAFLSFAIIRDAILLRPVAHTQNWRTECERLESVELDNEI
jgi:hypothetical protein